MIAIAEVGALPFAPRFEMLHETVVLMEFIRAPQGRGVRYVNHDLSANNIRFPGMK